MFTSPIDTRAALNVSHNVLITLACVDAHQLHIHTLAQSSILNTITSTATQSIHTPINTMYSQHWVSGHF